VNEPLETHVRRTPANKQVDVVWHQAVRKDFAARSGSSAHNFVSDPRKDLVAIKERQTVLAAKRYKPAAIAFVGVGSKPRRASSHAPAVANGAPAPMCPPHV
jgi:hypothetical protein